MDVFDSYSISISPFKFSRPLLKILILLILGEHVISIDIWTAQSSQEC